MLGELRAHEQTYGEQELWYLKDILYLGLGRIVNVYFMIGFDVLKSLSKLVERTHRCGSDL